MLYNLPHKKISQPPSFTSAYLAKNLSLKPHSSLTYSMMQSPSWEANWFAATQEIPTFHGTRRFITAFTSVRHLSLSWASPIQSIYPHPTSWRSILVLSTHLCLGAPSSLFPSSFLTKTLYAPQLSKKKNNEHALQVYSLWIQEKILNGTDSVSDKQLLAHIKLKYCFI